MHFDPAGTVSSNFSQPARHDFMSWPMPALRGVTHEPGGTASLEAAGGGGVAAAEDAAGAEPAGDDPRQLETSRAAAPSPLRGSGDRADQVPRERGSE